MDIQIGLDLLFFLLNEEYTKLLFVEKRMNERSSERRGLGLKNTLYENFRKLIHYSFWNKLERSKESQ